MFLILTVPACQVDKSTLLHAYLRYQLSRSRCLFLVSREDFFYSAKCSKSFCILYPRLLCAFNLLIACYLWYHRSLSTNLGLSRTHFFHNFN